MRNRSFFCHFHRVQVVVRQKWIISFVCLCTNQSIILQLKTDCWSVSNTRQAGERAIWLCERMGVSQERKRRIGEKESAREKEIKRARDREWKSSKRAIKWPLVGTHHMARWRTPKKCTKCYSSSCPLSTYSLEPVNVIGRFFSRFFCRFFHHFVFNVELLFFLVVTTNNAKDNENDAKKHRLNASAQYRFWYERNGPNNVRSRCRQTSYTPMRYVFINDFNPYQLSLSNCHVHLTLDNSNDIECNEHDDDVVTPCTVAFVHVGAIAKRYMNGACAVRVWSQPETPTPTNTDHRVLFSSI